MVGKTHELYKKQNDGEEYIIELKRRLRKIGLEAIHVQLKAAEEHGCARRKHRVPLMAIYMRNHEDYKALNLPGHDGNWCDVYPKTDEIRDIWREISERYGVAEKYYMPNMFVFFYDYAVCWLLDWIYMNRELTKKISGTPFVYPSSVPSVRIVYGTEREYSSRKKDFSRIKKEIFNEIFSEIPQEYQCDAESLLTIEFWHREMDGYNSYGFARCD